MKIQPECLPCLLKRCLYEVQLVNVDKSTAKNAMINAIETLMKEFNRNECSAVIATKVHKAVYDSLGCKDPYKEMKERSNKVALSLLPKIENIVRASPDPLESAILCSIIGNILDFGIKGGGREPEKLKEDFERLYREGFGYTDYKKFKEILSAAKNAMLFTDNCGEIVFDKLLCREIKNFNPELNLTVVVKGEPVLSDATREDADKLKFNEVTDEAMDTGTFAVGLDPYNIPEHLEKKLRESDIIICKGMANYEVFSELDYRPITYLLRIKCEPIARSLGLKTGINVLRVME